MWHTFTLTQLHNTTTALATLLKVLCCNTQEYADKAEMPYCKPVGYCYQKPTPNSATVLAAHLESVSIVTSH